MRIELDPEQRISGWLRIESDRIIDYSDERIGSRIPPKTKNPDIWFMPIPRYKYVYSALDSWWKQNWCYSASLNFGFNPCNLHNSNIKIDYLSFKEKIRLFPALVERHFKLRSYIILVNLFYTTKYIVFKIFWIRDI